MVNKLFVYWGRRHALGSQRTVGIKWYSSTRPRSQVSFRLVPGPYMDNPGLVWQSQTVTRGLSSFPLHCSNFQHSDWSIVTAWDMMTSAPIVLEALEHNQGMKKGRVKEVCPAFFFLKEMRLALVGQKQFTKPGLRESAKNSQPLKLKSIPLKNGCWASR